MNIHIADKALRKAMFSVFGGRCFYSGRELNDDNFHIDHIVPKIKGGEDSVFNYVPCDSQINVQKSDNYDKNSVVGVLYLVKTVYAQKVIKEIERIRSIKGKNDLKLSKRKGNDALRKATKSAGYTQETLARAVGTSGKTIYNAINGMKPHENTRKAICKVLGKTLDELFNN